MVDGLMENIREQEQQQTARNINVSGRQTTLQNNPSTPSTTTSLKSTAAERWASHGGVGGAQELQTTTHSFQTQQKPVVRQTQILSTYLPATSKARRICNPGRLVRFSSRLECCQKFKKVQEEKRRSRGMLQSLTCDHRLSRGRLTAFNLI